MVDGTVWAWGANTTGQLGTGTQSLSNAFDAVVLESGFGGNSVGGTVAGARNVISGNGRNGVVIQGQAETNDVVQGNFIGVDVTGTNALGNTGIGVVITDANSASIGGTAPGAGNIIAHNALEGIGVHPDGHIEGKNEGGSEGAV